MAPRRKQPPAVIDTSDSSWHLDRKVPVAIILALGLQTAGVVWWGATAAEGAVLSGGQLGHPTR